MAGDGLDRARRQAIEHAPPCREHGGRCPTWLSAAETLIVNGEPVPRADDDGQADAAG